MAPVDLVQITIQVLGNPAWQGVGVIISSALSVVALRNSQQHTPQHNSTFRVFKKIPTCRFLESSISGVSI